MRIIKQMDLQGEFAHMDYAEMEELYREMEVFPIQQDEEEIQLLPPWMEADATPPDTPDAPQEELPLLPPDIELDDDTLRVSPSPVFSSDEDDGQESGIWLYNLVTRRHEYVENPDVRDCPEALRDSPMSPDSSMHVDSPMPVIDLLSSPEPEIVAIFSPEVKILCEVKRPREEDSDDDDDDDYSAAAARPCDIRKRPRPNDDDDDDEDFFAPCHCFNCLPPPRRRLF